MVRVPPTARRSRSLDSGRPTTNRRNLAPPQQPLERPHLSRAGLPRNPSPRRAEEVSIDSLTAVPVDVYDTFLKAGLRAKARGQHRLQVEWGEGEHSAKVRLVKSSRR
mmetsp:Transcript_55085/g.131263  ORF Transcript_55085/g.131263 Transcript_55085/m.131263 type:complete len:108 (-) Transcript_55085:349-672(-)